MDARSVTDKILATVFPITAFVALGNVLGGTVLVALVYWSVYLRYSD